MTRFLRQAAVVGALLLPAVAIPAQQRPPAARPIPGHHLLASAFGTWRHSSGGMGQLTLTLNPDGTFTFAQIKSGDEPKRLAGEYAFLNATPPRTGTEVLLYSGPRAHGKEPSVRWSYIRSGRDAITFRDRMFFRVTP